MTHRRVPTGIYEGEFVDVFFDSPCVGNCETGNPQTAALRRARSSAMVRNRSADKTPYYTSNPQYLHARGRTFEQNQTTLLRQGDATTTPGAGGSFENVYASNTPVYCPGQVAGETGPSSAAYYPVYHHPGNAQYNTQGAVTAAERIWRLRYNATALAGPPMTTPYGVLQPNALAFVNGKRIFDLKDRIGAPYPCHPRITPQGEMQCVPLYYPNVAFGPA